MRVLLIHADKFSYEAVKKAIKSAESLDEVPKKGEAENALVLFVTVEPGDKEVVADAVKEISEHAKRIGVKRIVVYPYAHLSSNLAKPWEALEVLRTMAKMFSDMGFEVLRAPFGWYKRFELSCKGHPLAELSKSFRPKRKETPFKKILWITPDGTISEDLDQLKDDELRKLRDYLEGNVSKCEDLVSQFCEKFGVVMKKTGKACTHRYKPLAYFMYNTILLYANYLGESLEIPVFLIRGSIIDTNCDANSLRCEDFCLRDSELAQVEELIEEELDVLPVGIYEIAHLYRNENDQVICKRCSSFTVPTITTYFNNLSDVLNHVLMIHDLIHAEAEKIGQKYVVLYNVNEKFFEDVKDVIVKMIKRDNRCALVRLFDDPEKLIDTEYFIINNCGVPVEIGSWTLSKKRDDLYIVKSAPIGSIERFLYMILDKAAKEFRENKTPSLPVWLAPIQARVIPVNRELLTYAMSVADELKSYGIRVDVDDRNLSLGRKIRDAGKEWIPYVVIVGKREKETGSIVVNIRGSNDRVEMTIEELAKKIKEAVGSYPQMPQSLPLLYSKRPKFAKPSS
ncbi:hypothetical protein IPA_05655 [Ignicoccus pacificus DSM 13166]|uniref:Threonine--tRNA ligase editing subunit n=1 Tax=Ignicoccus pacificus DSM 13166 TaxID=940294 RepID=A0A977KB96_9CREN|nr:hypothetical protein IPA_05655 [Ignicoccus pacificus DSM 13166]